MAWPLNSFDGAFFDLSLRVKIRVTGEDRYRYLNGQITNDLGKVTDARTVAACILNAKGKMDAHVFVSSDGNAFLIDAEESLRDTIPKRLERYIIADQVELEDVTDDLSVLHVLGAIPGELPPDCRIVSVNRFGPEGHDLWIESSRRPVLFQALEGAIPFCDADCTEVFRIEQGIPRWGAELTPDILPPEANLEQSCIDYGKGCYVGQEVISRMKMSGQRSKVLCGISAPAELVLKPGMRLHSDEGKEIGWVTSAAMSARFQAQLALAYVKRGFNAPGTKVNIVTADSRQVSAEIVDLPFGSG